jgi:2-methylcitrate dehydratase PrpD
MTDPNHVMTDPGAVLAHFAATAQWHDVPAPVQRRIEELFLDWMGAALAGKGAHVVEQDDVHSGAVFHPAAVVFPPALAVAQALGRSGADFLMASVVGYEVGIRVGEFRGRSHHCTFRTAATAGLTAAYLAADGFTGATRIFDGAQGMAAGMSSDADPAKLADALGTRWTVAETSFKWHASCRHTHPAADALQLLMHTHTLAAHDVATVVARVHQAALDVLGPVTDHEVDPAYPARWIGTVEVTTADGRRCEARVDEPKGDPGNTLSRAELEAKAIRLAQYGGGASATEMQQLITSVWTLAKAAVVPRFLS